MKRRQLADLTAFIAVAQERGLTPAAAKLGIAHSSLSHASNRLESQLDLSVLASITQSVALTEAAEHLLRTLRPARGSIDDEFESLTELLGVPLPPGITAISRAAGR